jgi:hypothetical protein
MAEPWTMEDEATLKELRRRKAKHDRDATRQRRYSPKKKKEEVRIK